MTTPAPSDILKHFTADFATFNEDLSNYQDLGTQKSGVRNAYNHELGNIDWNPKNPNPWLIMMQVMNLLCGSGVNLVNNSVDQKGEESECQSALLKCQNDLQNITNEKGNGSNGLVAEAQGMDKLIAAFAPSAAGAKPTLEEQVFLPSGCANVSSNFLTVRKQIWYCDPDYPNPPGQTWAGSYFDNVPTTEKMTSYGQMKDNMSKQGDPLNAIEANTQLTNAFGTNTSILQSVQQQTKELLNEAVNVVKTIESAGSAMGHSVSQVSSAAIQNMKGN